MRGENRFEMLSEAKACDADANKVYTKLPAFLTEVALKGKFALRGFS